MMSWNYVFRILTPLILGFFIGSFLSLALFPNIPTDSTTALDNNNNNADKICPPDTAGNGESMEAIIHQPAAAPQQGAGPSKRPPIPKRKPKVARPRFYASEFGLKDKLFVGVLTKRGTLPTLGVALNRTVSHHVNRMVFFLPPHSSGGDGLSETNNIDDGSFDGGKTMNIQPLISPATAAFEKSEQSTIAATANSDSGSSHHLNIFSVIEEIGKTGAVQNYDWFFLMPGTTYVRPFKLFELVSHLSIGQDLLMGTLKRQKNSDAVHYYCDWNAGMLISNGVMVKILESLSQCKRLADPSADITENLGQCLQGLIKIECSEESTGKSLRSFELLDGWSDQINEFLADTKRTLSNPKRSVPAKERGEKSSAQTINNNIDMFLGAMVLHPVQNPVDVYQLHGYVCQTELEAIRSQSKIVQREIANITDTLPGPRYWPPSAPAPARPKTRYEAFTWDFFAFSTPGATSGGSYDGAESTARIFANKANTNHIPLTGADRTDLERIVGEAKRFLIQGGDGTAGKVRKATTEELDGTRVTGFRKFDPTRGMDYIVDFEFPKSGVPRHVERVHLYKPLTRAEIIPVPYVTEVKEVLIVMALEIDQVDAGRKFLDRFAEVCLDAGDSSRLLFVLIQPKTTMSSVNGQPSVNQLFNPLIQDIRTIRKQFGVKNGKGGMIQVLRLRDNGMETDLLTITEAVIDKNGRDHLFLFMSPWVELHQDFMNRVRMNTVQGFQVFFPVPFVQFNTKISRFHENFGVAAGGLGSHQNSRMGAGKQKSASTSINNQEAAEISVHKTSGHFDANDFTVASFYGSDFMNNLDSENRQEKYPKQQMDLSRVFAGKDGIHLMRAVDPSLKIRHHRRQCTAVFDQLIPADQHRCYTSELEGLASRPQLATLVLQKEFNRTELAILAKKNRA